MMFGGAIFLTQSYESLPVSTWLGAEENMLVRRHASRNAETIGWGQIDRVR